MKKSSFFILFAVIFVSNFIVATNCPTINFISNAAATTQSVDLFRFRTIPKSVNTPSGRVSLDTNGEYGRFGSDWSELGTLVNFINYEGAAKDNQTVRYVAEAVYNVGYNCYTTGFWSDCVTSSTATPTTKNWVRYREYYIDYSNKYHWSPEKSLSITYSEYAMKTGTQMRFFNPIVQFRYDTIPEILFEGNASVVNAHISNTLVTGGYYGSSQIQPVGSYLTSFSQTNTASAQLYTTDSISDKNAGTESIILESDKEDDLKTWLVNNAVGVDVDSPTPITYQQSDNRGGTENDAITITNNEAMLQITVQPEINVYKQPIKVKSTQGVIEIRKAGGWFGDAITYFPTTHEDTYLPIRAVSINNFNVKGSVNVRVQLVCDIEMTGKITADAWLGDPVIKRGDMIWDMMMTGQTGVAFNYINQSPTLSSYLNDVKTIVDTTQQELDEMADSFAKNSQKIFEQIKQWGILIGIVVLCGVGVYLFIKFR